MQAYFYLSFIIVIEFSCFGRSETIKKGDAGFLFMYPKVMTSNQNETVCVSAHNVLTPFRIVVDMKIKEKHYTTKFHSETDYCCFEVKVPKLRYHLRDVHYANLHLQVELNDTIHTSHAQGPIVIYPNSNTFYIETDKNFYKPGDTIKIRILVLNQHLKPPENYKVSSVKIINPSGITVNVWEHVPTHLGLLQLDYLLADETKEGKWRIEVADVYKIIQVKQYTLPRFKVYLESPKAIYSDANETFFLICAKYSYGKSVKGSAFIKIGFKYFEREAVTRVKELKDGCVNFTFSNKELYLHEQVHSHLTITAVVTEYGTHRAETETLRTRVVNEAYKIKFSNEAVYFQPGFPYYGKLIATNNLIDLRKETVEICYTIAVNYIWNIKNIKECSHFSFDGNNGIDFSIPPLMENVIKIDLQAESLNQTIKEEWPTRFGQSYPIRYSTKVTAYFSVSRWYSPSHSYINVKPNKQEYIKCHSTQRFIVNYASPLIRTFKIESFYYIVKSRSKILQSGRILHTPTKQYSISFDDTENVIGSNHAYVKNNGTVEKFTFALKLNKEIYSKAQLLIYFILLNMETVASSTYINIEKCLHNRVEAKWSDTSFRPGDETKLTIKTTKNSLCAISAVDKSSVILSNSRSLNVHSILRPFILEKESKQTSRLNCIPKHMKKISGLMTSSPKLNSKRRKRFSSRLLFSSQLDSYEAFDNIGIGFISNLNILSKPCEEDLQMALSSVSPQPEGYFSSHSSTKDFDYNIDDEDGGTLRRFFFPETWLWELLPVGNNGETEIVRFLPHSITKWITNVLCTSANGISLSSVDELSVFQPFFLEVLSPHSIKRNEIMHLQTAVFNYLNYSIPIRISLESSEELDLVDYHEERSVTHCIYSNDSKTAIFRIKTAKLGKINITIKAEVDSSYPGECGPDIIINKRDEVTKEILVEPEGHLMEKTTSMLLCAKDNYVPNNVSWNFDLPKEFIPNSESGIISIDAELMGPTVKNIEKLINIPTGCGEQLVSVMAPNLYILRYLNFTGKLTFPLRQRIMKNLKIGYQRILSYVHEDGSFSAFGYHDNVGSMFLTSFVVRTLEQAKHHIYVDQNLIDKAVQWILSNQLENGCFNAVSHVFHNMGGTSSENSTAALTSYVLISLLESGIELTEKVRTDAKYCIRGHYSPDKYTLAISSYALSLVGWHSEAIRALKRLLEIATVKNNLMWWSNSGSVATDIEMTAYVLMSLLHQNNVENLVHAHSVVKWLITQRNSNGGFTTSQDTAVALDAISRYMVLVKGKAANLSVHVTTGEKHYDISINNKDRLKTKEIPITNISSSATVIVNGEGCVLASNTIKYNLVHMMNSEAFKLAVDVETVSSTDTCSVAMVSPCLAYKLPEIHSNMAVLEIKMPTGYEPDRGSLYKLKEDNSKIKRFEDSENQVILYFTELNNEPICVPFTITENSNVDERVDAIVKLYDYYNPEMKVATTYHVNTCKPNKIAPLPTLPPGTTSNNSVYDTSPIDNIEITTLYTLDFALNSTEN